jgi:dCMP deaminase
MLKRKNWDSYYHDIAKRVAERSTCLSVKIGAILVQDKIIVCEGYNGPARGIPACGVDRLKQDYELAHRMNDALVPIYGDAFTCPRKRLGYGSSEGLYMCPSVHAEANCIINSARIGICTFGTHLYLTCGIPCKDCLSLIINAGIKEIIVAELNYYDNLSKYIQRVSGISIRTYEKE